MAKSDPAAARAYVLHKEADALADLIEHVAHHLIDTGQETDA